MWHEIDGTQHSLFILKIGLIVINFFLDVTLRFCLSFSRTAEKPVVKYYNKNVDITKKDRDDNDDDYDEEDDDDYDDDDDDNNNNNNKEKMNNKTGRIFGKFFDPFRPQLLTVGLGSLTMGEVTNLSEPYSANSMIR